jgi:hypothetical protein
MNFSNGTYASNFLDQAVEDEGIAAVLKRMPKHALVSVLSQIMGHGRRVIGETGQNGGPIGYTAAGDKVEWLPDPEAEDALWPSILLRNENTIRAEREELRDKVWWNGHQNWLHELKTGKETLTAEELPSLSKAQREAQRIEDKYGLENLVCDTFGWGLLMGRLRALEWVLGDEWEDTMGLYSNVDPSPQSSTTVPAVTKAKGTHLRLVKG